MSRATLHDQSFLGHQGVYPGIMRHAAGGGDGGGRRPSRLLQMKDDYQRRLMKEKEEKMVSMYETQQRKNLERAERVVKAPGVPSPHEDYYPNSRLRQPGYMQQQQQQQQHPGHNNNNASGLRDFFKERREMEAKGGYVPPIKQHFNDSRTRTGSGRGSAKKNSAGVDRANPLAPIQHGGSARHGGISSAPAQHPPMRNKPNIVKQNSSSPDFDLNGHVKPNQQKVPPKKHSPQQARGGNPSGRAGVSPKTEKMSDFQKWQMEQNKAREDRLKKLNMRAPPSERESRDWGRDYEYEEEEEAVESARDDPGQDEEIRRREEEIMQRIAQQQAELDRLRREREEEEELEQQEAEKLRKQQAAERERRHRQQQEEARRRRQEEAQARREEEEQKRAARARQERQRFEAHLDLYGDSAAHDTDPNYPGSQPNSYRENPFQPNSHRGANPFQPNSHRENPFQPNSYRENPSQQNSYLSGNSNTGYYHRDDDSDQTTPKHTPKPPSEPPRKASQSRHQRPTPAQKKASLPAEQYDEVPVPGPGVDFYAQATDEERGVKIKLVACKHCKRKFADDRIQKHQAACKNALKKREAFDPTQMRTGGTDMAKYIRQGAHMKEPPKKKKADWRRQHQEFISNIRYAKQMQQMEQQGVAAKDLPPPPPSQVNHDLVPCPHCGRTFNETAAERHIPRCQELKTRPLANNNNRRRR